MLNQTNRTQERVPWIFIVNAVGAAVAKVMVCAVSPNIDIVFVLLPSHQVNM